MILGGPSENVERLAAGQGLQLEEATDEQLARWRRLIGVAELMIPPNSKYIGHNLVELNFQGRTGLRVIGIRRRGDALKEKVVGTVLESGDVLLTLGTWTHQLQMRSRPRDAVLLDLPSEAQEASPALHRSPLVIVVVALMICSMVFDWAAPALSVLVAGALLVLGRVMNMSEAYRGIDWRTVLVVAAMLPLAQALEQTGVISFAVAWLSPIAEGMSPRAVMLGLYAVTSLLSLFISNTATAVLIAPVAVELAENVGVAPQSFCLAVGFAASAAFATPVSSPVNMMVVEPGGYRFGDFFRVGAPIVVLVAALTVLVVPLLYPF